MPSKDLVKKEKNNIVYIDILKIIACFLVIVNHAGGYILEKNNTFKAELFYAFNWSLCKMAVSIFIMVTGILILDKKYDFKKVFKSAFRILVPTIIVSLYYLTEFRFTNFNFIRFIKNAIENPVMIPLWYSYMLIGLYIVTPFIQKMIKPFDKKDYRYFIGIFFILPATLGFISTVTNIKYSQYFMMSFFPIIIGIYVLGNYISKIEISKKHFIISIIIFFISFITMFTVTTYPMFKGEAISRALDYYAALPVVMMGAATVYIVRYITEKKNINKYLNKLVYEVSQVTYGIYLYHFIVIYKLYNSSLAQRVFACNEYVGITFLEISIFIYSGLIIYILKKIPVVKKFL